MGLLTRMIERWHAERARQKALPPEPPLPDWSRFGDYYALATAIHEAGAMTPDAFLDGPCTRFLELCSGDDPPRARARAMEFGRGALQRQIEKMVERGEAIAPFEARAWALAHRYLDAAPAGDYMLEVLEGRATHNYRASPLTDAPRRDDSSTLP